MVFLGATYISTSLYDNYMKAPVLFVIPLAAVGALIGILLFIRQAQWLKAWFSSAVFIVMVTLFGVVRNVSRICSYPASIRHSA